MNYTYFLTPSLFRVYSNKNNNLEERFQIFGYLIQVYFLHYSVQN